MTWAELGFYDIPLIRPNGFVNSGRQGVSNQELGELRIDPRGMAIIGSYPVSVYHTEESIRLKKRGAKTLEIDLVQTKELAYEISGSR